MKTYSKWVFCLIVGTLAITGLTGCGGNAPGQQGPEGTADKPRYNGPPPGAEKQDQQPKQ